MKRTRGYKQIRETQKSRPHYSSWSIAWQSEFTMAVTLQDLDTKPFTDGADKAQIFEMSKQAWIKGFTTNPSLMKAAGVTDYVSYARELVAAAPDRHISF